MDRKERVELRLQQEELENAISEIQKKLREHGEKLRRVVNTISVNPNLLLFIDFPMNIGKNPPGIPAADCISWSDLPTKEQLLDLSLDLQKKLRASQEITASLQQK